jgi:2-iminobutanoate/2-iminopropanoate deaminase
MKKIETQNAPKAVGPYSQAISDGHLLFVSGQLAFDPATGKIIEGTIREQTKQVLKNLEAILKAGNSSLSQVLRTDVFLANLSDFKAMNEEYASWFKDPYPARQTIEAKLFSGALVEISCIAKINNT